MENRSDTQEVASDHRTTRMNIVDGLDSEMQTNKNLNYYTTNHFIVVYQGGKELYKHFGGWLDTHPSSLAEFLEDRSQKALTFFKLPEPKDVEVLTFRKGGFGDLFLGGYHSGQNRHQFSMETTPAKGANYSHIFPRPKDMGDPKPNIYATGIHEAIGHGMINTQLMGRLRENSPREIPFIEEGLATFITNYLEGKSSHEQLAAQIVDDLLWNISESGEEIKQMPLDKIVAVLNKKGYMTNVKTGEMFSLKSDSHDSSARHDFSMKGALPHYYRGSSFMQYLIEAYGIDRFKDWVVKANPANFYHSLQENFKKPIEELECEWKKCVFEQPFTRNQQLLNININKKESQKQEHIQTLEALDEKFKPFF